MKEKVKNKINILIIFIVTFIVLFFALKDDFNEIIHQMVTINIIWLIIAFLLVIAYFYLRSIVLNDCITRFKKKHRFRDTFALTLKTQFFNGVTPFATGGQPFQVYMLKKDNIKLSHATNIIIQNFILYQMALVLLGLIAIISNYFIHFFKEVTILKYLVTLGFIMNILVTLVLFILAFTTKLNNRVGRFGIKILKKFRIIKNPEQAIFKWQEYVENFHDGAIILLQDKKNFVKGIFYNFMALCALYLIPLVLLYGIGQFNVIKSYQAIITSAYVMIIGSFVPIPGGTGGLEYGFIAFYGNFIKGPTLKTIMLLWRFITYYLGMMLGAIILGIKKKED